MDTDKENLEPTIPEVVDPVTDLTSKQELVLQALLTHSSIKDAAVASGTSEVTIHRYMKDEVFTRRLREARREALSHVAARLQMASDDAVTVLHKLLNKEDAPATAKISAARTVLDYTFRVAQIDELKAKIEELQDFVNRKWEANALASGADDEEEDER